MFFKEQPPLCVINASGTFSKTGEILAHEGIVKGTLLHLRKGIPLDSISLSELDCRYIAIIGPNFQQFNFGKHNNAFPLIEFGELLLDSVVHREERFTCLLLRRPTLTWMTVAEATTELNVQNEEHAFLANGYSGLYRETPKLWFCTNRLWVFLLKMRVKDNLVARFSTKQRTPAEVSFH